MPKKNYSVSLYSLLLPVLILIAVVLFGAAAKSDSENLKQKSEILSSGSGEDGDGNSDDDDDDNSGSGSNDDDDDGDENEDDNSGSEGDDEDDNDSSGSGSGDDDEDEVETREFITNPDGTTTEIRRETDDGETKVEFRTYDAAGNKIGVEKYESEDGEEKIRIKTYDAFGIKLSDLKFETEDGKEIEFRVKEGDVELSRVRFDADEEKLVVRTDDEANSLTIRVSGDNFILTRNGANALSNFPIIIDDQTGQIFVKTPVGDIELKAMPDSIIERANLAGSIVEDDELELEADDGIKYVLTGIKLENLLGIFQVSIPSQLVYDAETGQFLSSEQGFIARVLDLFSF